MRLAPLPPWPQTNGGVPDGGLTVMLLGVSLAGLGWLRRKF
jgi:hypothetical protein